MRSFPVFTSRARGGELRGPRTGAPARGAQEAAGLRAWVQHAGGGGGCRTSVWQWGMHPMEEPMPHCVWRSLITLFGVRGR